MQIVEDKELKYEDKISLLLRTHNNQYVKDRLSDKKYFYYKIENQIHASMDTVLFWDWVSLNHIQYENSEQLKDLLGSVIEYYKDRSQGLKLYTSNEKLIADLQGLGFITSGQTITTNKVKASTYLTFDFSKNMPYTSEHVISYDEKLDKKDTLSEDVVTKYAYVALKQDQFIGGVTCQTDEDYLYVSRLAIDPSFKKRGIGTALMKEVESLAKKLKVYCITLGTTSFQAIEFYEKLGYQVYLKKENDPKDYNTYSMVKYL